MSASAWTLTIIATLTALGLLAAWCDKDGRRLWTQRAYRRDARLQAISYGRQYASRAEADQLAIVDATREEPAGRHHRRQSHGERVVLASVTDLGEKRRQP